MSWERFKSRFLHIPELGFSLDVSRMNYGDEFLDQMEPQMRSALESMQKLEEGAIANPDENRMVGHYWLRAPKLAPEAALTEDIQQTLTQVREFASQVHSGQITGPGGRFTRLLIIGIGGSALGPQFVAQALGHPTTDALQPYFFDNTDPDGMDLVLAEIGDKLAETLVVVISKSGGTPETRNGMLEAQSAFMKANLDFSKQAVAITGEGSKLDRTAQDEGWLARFPMWDWVGGRTSETGPVGLLPAALQGLDIDALLEGAASMDRITRRKDIGQNPAAMLALMWYYATNGKGEKDMVILPYKDRLALFSKYLQQLIMESLGKEKDLDGKVVHQGIAVYGNKGSTDQHAYVQQLREGVNNFFVTFIEVLRDRKDASIEVEDGFTSGDFLKGFLLGTRDALSENGRESITITVESVMPETVGMLVALYERAVGLYASLININAYHQPGVEAGKKAAAANLKRIQQISALFEDNKGTHYSVDEVARELDAEEEKELLFKLLEHMTANKDKCVEKQPGESLFDGKYGCTE